MMSSTVTHQQFEQESSFKQVLLDVGKQSLFVNTRDIQEDK